MVDHQQEMLRKQLMDQITGLLQIGQPLVMVLQETVLHHQLVMEAIAQLLVTLLQIDLRTEIVQARGVALLRPVVMAVVVLHQLPPNQTEDQTQVMEVIEVHRTPLIQVIEVVDQTVVIVTKDLRTQITA